MKWTDPARWRGRIAVTAPPTSRTPRTWIAAVAAVWTVLALYVAQAHLPDNVVKLPGQASVTDASRTVLPQGWAFFTKSPRDPDMGAWTETADGWQDARLGRHAEFGFDRASRAQGVELGVLFYEARDIEPLECEGRTAPACLAAAPVSAEVVNPGPSPTLCGRVGIVHESPVPFAWRDLYDTTHIVENALVLEVTCS